MEGEVSTRDDGMADWVKIVDDVYHWKKYRFIKTVHKVG